MQVLVVGIGRASPVGGATLRTLRICAELLRAGVDLDLVLLDKGLEEGQLERDFSIPEHRVTRLRCWNHRFSLPEPALRKLDPLVAQADLLYLSAHLWGAAPLAWALALRHCKPWVVCPAGAVPYFGRSLLLKRTAHWLFGARMLRGAAAICAITEMEREALLPYAAADDRVVVLPNGVLCNGSPFAGARPEGSGGDGEPFALYLGRLEAVKGVDLLIHAYAALGPRSRDRLQLCIAGEGSQKAGLESLCRRLGVAERVRFVGHLEGMAKDQLLRASSFVVIPSRRDAMTQVVLEAGLFGRPVLMTRSCGFPAAGRCGGGIEVEPDVAGLNAGLAEMLSAERAWPAMGAKLRDLTFAEYSWARIGQLHVELFRRVLQQ